MNDVATQRGTISGELKFDFISKRQKRTTKKS